MAPPRVVAVRSALPHVFHRDANGSDGGWHARQAAPISEVVSLSRARDDTLWAVVAQLGRTSRVAEIFPSRVAALADRSWREQQVRAYAGFLSSTKQPVPHYSVAPIRRADLPRSWRPLPALGFLRGQFI